MKKPSQGGEFVWLIGKPGQWGEIRETIQEVTHQRAGGIFTVMYGEENENKLECQIIWDQKLRCEVAAVLWGAKRERGGVKLARWREWWRKFHRPANRYTRRFRG